MQRFKNILCVVDPALDSENVITRAVALADSNQARLTVVVVIDEIPANTTLMERVMSPVNLQAKVIAEHEKWLQDLVAIFNENLEIQTEVLIGVPFLEVIYDVLRNGRDLVVKAAENGGLMDRVFGSDDMHLLRKCPCPVWLVTAESPGTYKRILAAVDVDENYQAKELDIRQQLNYQILEMAGSLALSESAELHIVHAWEAVGEGVMRGGFMARPEKEVISYVEEVKQQHSHNLQALINVMNDKLGKNTLKYIKPETHLIKGAPRSTIPEFAGQIKADLVVMGTVGRTGLPGFIMGNTAETILNQLNCSVLAIKPPGFETPVTLDD